MRETLREEQMNRKVENPRWIRHGLLAHEHDGDAFADSAEATRVEETVLHGLGLEQLLEHHPVRATLPRRHADSQRSQALRRNR